MKAYVEQEWNTMSEKRKEYIVKRKKIRIENEENPKRYVNVILPIDDGELNDIMGDMLGRYKDGYVLDNSFVNHYYTLGHAEIEDIFLENELAMWFHKIEEPPYLYGKNPAVTKENGEVFRGTIESSPKHKVRKDTL